MKIQKIEEITSQISRNFIDYMKNKLEDAIALSNAASSNFHQHFEKGFAISDEKKGYIPF